MAESTALAVPFPPPSELRGMLLDIDGTLADSDPLHYIAFRVTEPHLNIGRVAAQDMLQALNFAGGEPITHDFFVDRISGGSNPVIFASLFPDATPAEHQDLADRKEATFRALAGRPGQLPATAGLERLVQYARAKGLRRAAVTNAPRENAEQILAALGLTEFFEELIIGGECERSKPHPEPYLEAMRRLGLQPHQCFAVEDSLSGLRAAVAAGVCTLGICTTQKAEALLGAGATMVIRDFNDAALWSALEGGSRGPAVLNG